VVCVFYFFRVWGGGGGGGGGVKGSDFHLSNQNTLSKKKVKFKSHQQSKHVVIGTEERCYTYDIFRPIDVRR
jgi:hypothetical protein